MSVTLLVCEMSPVVWQFEHSLSLPFFETGMKTDLTTWMFSIAYAKRTAFAVSKEKKFHFNQSSLKSKEYHGHPPSKSHLSFM